MFSHSLWNSSPTRDHIYSSTLRAYIQIATYIDYKFAPHVIQSRAFNNRHVNNAILPVGFPRSAVRALFARSSSVGSFTRTLYRRDAALFGGERETKRETKRERRSERRRGAARRGGGEECSRAIPGNRLPRAMRGPRAAPALTASSWVATVTS